MTVMMMPLYNLFPATQRENRVVTSKFTERFRKEKKKRKLLWTKLNLLTVWLRHLYSDLFVISQITFRHCCLAWSRLHENLSRNSYIQSYILSWFSQWVSQLPRRYWSEDEGDLSKEKRPTDDEYVNGLGKGNATISKEHIYQRFREITRKEHRI